MKRLSKSLIDRLNCAGIAFSLFLGIFSLSLTADDTLVYCPLQKAWVERSPERKTSPVLDLDDMCAADRLKSAFVRALTESLRVKNQDDTETAFWSFAESGDVSGHLPSQPTNPGQFQAGVSPVTAAGSKHRDSVFDIEPSLTAQNFARPPTDDEPEVLHYSVVAHQSPVLRSIQPRAPPVS